MEGIIPLWKPRGMTSHDCVFQLRKIFKTKKVGHSGTLDPDVSGVLPICIGKATKVVEYLQDSNKVYVGEVTLGMSTETEDASGACVLVTPVVAPVSTQLIDDAMSSFLGEITQIPPMYSAVKVNGRRLYDYARNGEEVTRPVRKTMIYDYKRISEPIFTESDHKQSWWFEVACGKGTYVRTLAVDTGEKLGYAAHMSDLTRVESGGFTKEDAVSFDTLKQHAENGTLEELLYPVERALSEFTRLDIDESIYEVIKNGSVVEDNFFGELLTSEPIALFYEGKAMSIYAKHPTKEGLMKPIKVFRIN